MGRFGPFPWMGFMGLYMIYIPVGRICINMLVLWFIFLGYLYHFAHRIIYIPTWRICIILLVIWFIFLLGEFVSFCSSYDLCSLLGNSYNLLIVWFIFPLGEFVSFCLSYDLYSHLENLYDLFLERFLTLCCFGPSWGNLLSALSSTRVFQNLVKQEF